VTLLLAAGCGREPDEAERAGRAVMNRALAGERNWTCGSVAYERGGDKLTFGKCSASLAAEGLSGPGSELALGTLSADRVVLTGLGKADELEGALASPSWRGGKGLKLADSVVLEGLKAVPAETAGMPFSGGPALETGIRRVALEGPRLAEAAPDTQDGQAGYLRHLTLSRVALEGMSLRLSDGSLKLGIDSYEALAVGFGEPGGAAGGGSAAADGGGGGGLVGGLLSRVATDAAGSGTGGTGAPGAGRSHGPGPRGDILDVFLSQNAASDRAAGMSLSYSAAGQPSVTGAVAEVKATGIRGAYAFAAYELTGFRLGIATGGSDSVTFDMTLGSASLAGMDGRAFLMRVRSAFEELARTSDPDSLKRLSTLGDFLTLPYSLDSGGMKDFRARTNNGLDFGFRSVSWKGPAEAGRIYDSQASAEGLFLMAPPLQGSHRELRDLARLAEIFGLKELRVDLELSKKRDPGTGVTLWKIESLDARDLFGLTASVSFTGLSQELADLLLTIPAADASDTGTVLSLAGARETRGLGLAGIVATYRDGSLGSRLARFAAQQGGKMDDLADELAEELGQSAGEIGMTVNPAFVQNMRTALNSPGTFTLSWKPDRALTVGVLADSAFSQPQDGFWGGFAKFYLSVDGGPETAAFR
jgi:hypothetical protein